MTDSWTDELFSGDSELDVLRFPCSRLVVDPERFREDSDEIMAERGMGAVYTRTHDGRILKDGFDREVLLSAFYDPHHQALDEWTTSALVNAGRCLIVDCHSFPSQPLPCDLDQSPNRPDFCIGTCAPHTSPDLVDVVSSQIRHHGYTVCVDTPYSGTIVPTRFYMREPKVSSIMIEVNRRLYMNESTGEKIGGFDKVQEIVQDIVALVCSWPGFEQ